MKHIVLVPLVLFLCVAHAHATKYESGFGFTVDVPRHWLVVTHKRVMKNPDLFEAHGANSPYGVIEAPLMKRVVTQVMSGKVEIYITQSKADSRSADNIAVKKQHEKLPQDAAQTQRACDTLQAVFSKKFGRTVALYNCHLQRLNARAALQLEFDAAEPGTRSVQYRIQDTPRTTVVITATSKTNTLNRIRHEVRSIVNSIRF